ncbi:MAG: hypothetical protein AAF483_24555 [Planctomycetota bacterium]
MNFWTAKTVQGFPTLSCLLFSFLLVFAFGGCEVPAPAQYDHSMLRDFFGSTPEQIVDQFGLPDQKTGNVAAVESDQGAEDSDGSGDGASMSFEYDTVDGPLIFEFDTSQQVSQIDYLGNSVSPK